MWTQGSRVFVSAVLLAWGNLPSSSECLYTFSFLSQAASFKAYPPTVLCSQGPWHTTLLFNPLPLHIKELFEGMGLFIFVSPAPRTQPEL